MNSAVLDRVETPADDDADATTNAFADPLPKEDGEPAQWRAGAAVDEPVALDDDAVADDEGADDADDADGGSLTDLAKAFGSSADADDDGRASLSAALQARASAPSIPPPSGPTPNGPAPSTSGVGAQPASARVAPAAPVAAAMPAAKPANSNRGLLIGLVIGAVGAAAAVGLVALPNDDTAETVAMASKPAEQPKPTATAAAAPAPKADATDAISIDDLGSPPAAPASVAQAGGSGPTGAATAPDSKAPKTQAKPATAKIDDPDHPDDKNMKPAAGGESQPEKPSTGAVQAAIGRVLGGARACVAADDGPSRASITFGSNGRVQGVVVSSGPAAGKPAAACISGALKRARVAPFSRSSFTVGVTVRP